MASKQNRHSPQFIKFLHPSHGYIGLSRMAAMVGKPKVLRIKHLDFDLMGDQPGADAWILRIDQAAFLRHELLNLFPASRKTLAEGFLCYVQNAAALITRDLKNHSQDKGQANLPAQAKQHPL